jgi:uncharacterized repeat protein (TIGR01451 family)
MKNNLHLNFLSQLPNLSFGLLLFCLLISINSTSVFSQGASCAAAVSITVNGSCPSGTISDNTMELPAPTCGTQLRDGWYSFVATQTNARVTAITTNRQLLLQVFSGACGSLTQIGCANANTTDGAQTEVVALTGLTIGFTYYIKVVNETAFNMNLSSICVTACVPYTLPFTQNFESAWQLVTPGLTCWSEEWDPTDLDTRWHQDNYTTGWTSTSGAYAPTGANSSSRSARFHSYDVTSGKKGAIISPFFDFSPTGAATKTIDFYYINTSGTDVLNLYCSTDGGATWGTSLWTGATNAGWTQYTVNLTTSASTSCLFKFEATGDFGITDIGLDEINVYVSCTAPTIQASSFLVTGTTATTASISWTRGNGDNVLVIARAGAPPIDPTNGTGYAANSIYGSGAAVGGGFAVYNGTGTNVTVTGLTTGTTYYFAIYEYFSGTNCYNRTELTGNATACASLTLPYTQNFESVWQLVNPGLPCWSEEWDPTEVDSRWHQDNYTTGWSGTSGAYAPTGANSTSRSARFHSYDCSSGKKGAVISPAFDFSSYGASMKSIDFWYINTSGTDVLNLYISTNGGSTWSTSLWTGGVAAAWTLYTVDMTTSNTANFKFKFEATGDYGLTDIGLDEINVYLGCTPPNIQATSFMVTGTTATTASISWVRGNGDNVLVIARAGTPPTDPTNGTGYVANPIYGSGAAVGGGFAVYNGTGTSVTVTGLITGTTYYFAIYEYYSAGTCYNKNELAGSALACGTMTVPYLEDFESITVNNQLPSCMTATNLGTKVLTYITSGTYNRIPRSGTDFASFYYSCDDWLFTQGIVLTGGVTYDYSNWYITDGYSGWTTLEAKFGTSPSSLAMTGNIAGASVSGPTNTTYQELTGTFTPLVNGTYYIGIHCISNATPWYLSIDDISINVACAFPNIQASNFQVTGTTGNSASISWVRGNGNAVLVIAKADSPPSDPINGTAYIGNANYGSGDPVGGGFAVYNNTGTNVTVTGLSSGTTYYFAVYEYNSAINCYNRIELSGSVTPGCSLFSENFEAYGDALLPQTPGIGWRSYTITGSANRWATAGGAGVINGTRCLTLNDGTTNYQYIFTDNAEKVAYWGTKINATNYKNLKLDFKWKGSGEATDYGMVVWSTDGTNWQPVNSTQYYGQATTQTVSNLDLSACDNNQFYIGFKWVNDVAGGTNPPFTIDDISIKGTPYLGYSFSYRQDVFAPVSLGTAVTLDGTGGASISLPFTFPYAGTNVTDIRVSRNGWIRMNTTNPGVADVNDLNNNSFTPFLAPLWDNLTADAFTTILYTTTGGAPNRVFTIEWRNILWGGTRQNFQVKLFETIGVIEFVYGTMTAPVGGTASIGINDGSFCSSRFISVTPGNTPTISLSVPNNSINSIANLNSGLVYIFNPQAMQTYYSWQPATIVVGQVDWVSNNAVASQIIAAGANSSSVSSKGVLAVGSYYANRVLLWNTIPTANGTPADVVVGQNNFTATGTGCTNNRLSGPYNVAFSPDGIKLLVADAVNNRVLIWNTIPTTNGVAADVVIGQIDFVTSTAGCSSTKLTTPTGILVIPDGRLIITDGGNNRVLIYNSIPTSNGVAADYVIGQSDFVSSTSGFAANKLDLPWDAAFTPEGKLLISDNGAPALGNHRILVFNRVPTSNGVSADYIIGNTTFSQKPATTTKTGFDQPSVTVSCEGKIAIADFGNSRILVYNRVPNYNGAPADVVLGQPDFNTKVSFNDGSNISGTPSNKNMYYPYSICFDINGRLLANGTHGSGTGMHRVMIYGTTPTEIADLAVTITSNATGLQCIGSLVTYTVNITNNGPDDADHVVVNAALPVGFLMISSYTATGSYNFLSGYWTIPAIPVGLTVTLTFTGQITAVLGGNPNVIAYANILASMQRDNNFNNNGDNEILGVGNNNSPTITSIADVSIPRNSNTGPLPFTVGDVETPAGSLTLSGTSSNTTIVPNGNIVFGGAGANRTVTVTPAANQIGIVDIIVTVSDGTCIKQDTFKLTCGNVWKGTISTNWHTAGNWTYGVPTPTVEAIIPTHPIGPNFPIISEFFHYN